MGKKSVLITGSNGLLGQKIIAQLLQRDEYRLVATSKGPNRNSGLSADRYHSLDITVPEQIDSLFSSVDPDIVINTAAMTNVDLCESKKQECWELNVTALEHLLKGCIQSNAHFIQLSTDFVFDGANGPYNEEAVPNPISYYGSSKYAAEKLIESSNLEKWTIARTIILYGIAENMSRSNVVLWAKEALEKGTPINVVDDQFRSPTLAEDLAAGCLLIADQGAKGIYHLSGKETMSILELVNKVGDFFNLDTSIISPIRSALLNQAARRPPTTGFIIDKAINELGYKPKSFTEGLEVLSQQLELKKQS